MNNYLVYWKMSEYESCKAETHIRFDRMHGSYLKKAERGDLLWIVSADHGRLILFTRYLVGRVFKRSGTYIVDANRHHIERVMRHIEVPALALRFEGKHNRLSADYQAKRWQALRMMRKLTSATVATLEGLWNAPEPAVEPAII